MLIRPGVGGEVAGIHADHGNRGFGPQSAQLGYRQGPADADTVGSGPKSHEGGGQPGVGPVSIRRPLEPVELFQDYARGPIAMMIGGGQALEFPRELLAPVNFAPQEYPVLLRFAGFLGPIILLANLDPADLINDVGALIPGVRARPPHLQENEKHGCTSVEQWEIKSCERILISKLLGFK